MYHLLSFFGFTRGFKFSPLVLVAYTHNVFRHQVFLFVSNHSAIGGFAILTVGTHWAAVPWSADFVHTWVVKALGVRTLHLPISSTNTLLAVMRFKRAWWMFNAFICTIPRLDSHLCLVHCIFKSQRNASSFEQYS